MRRSAIAFVPLALVLLLGARQNAPPSGVLQVIIGGLPSDASADIVVAGPGD